MANAAGEEMATQIYAKPENGSGTGSTTDPYLIDGLIFEALKENPNPDSEIQKAVKLVKKMEEHISEITVKLNKRQLDESQAYRRLRYYEERDWGPLLTIKAKELASLKRDLNKLTFANNAYNERAIKTEENIINFHTLNFLMHHGTRNIAMENKLMKEANASQKKSSDHSDSVVSLIENIDARIRQLQYRIESNRFIREPEKRIDEKQARKDITELEWAKEKAIANASVNGEFWESLPSKEVIKQQIKLMEETCDEYRSYNLPVMADIKEVKREIHVIKKNISSLKKQLLIVQRKKQKAYKAVLELIKI